MKGFALVFATAMGASSMSLVAPTTSPSPSCAPVADIYAASATALQACGLAQVPLSSVSSLPGGGSAYNYVLPDGQTYSMVQPPAGFNPQSASAQEDAAYGVPPAPSPQSAGYAAWQLLTNGDYAPVPQRPYLVIGQPLSQPQTSGADGSSTNTNNYNSTWAGHSNDGTGWKEVQVTYTEPTLGPTGCSSPQVSFWSGIGDQANALGQTGTASGENGLLHQVWFENLPGGAAFPGVTAPKGSTVIANTYYDGSDRWTYSVDINGVNYIYYGTGGYDGSIAEAINKVHMFAQVGLNLDAMAPGTKWVMTGYATTSDISSGDFTVTQNSCSG
jgi:hypothetical protein